MTDLKPGLLRAAEICDNYERDGMLRREYACETADELAARIRQAAAELPEPVETGALVAGLKSLSASFEIRAQNMRGDPECVYEDSALCKEAADRIDALEAENARLRVIMDAAELINRGNVERAQVRCAPDPLYREHMYEEQRILDEAFQVYYERRATIGSEKK